MSKSTKKTEKVRLSDAQLIVLSNATQREDGVIALSDRLKGAAAQKFIMTLVDRGLAREMRAKLGMPVARRDEEGRAYALVITKTGRMAVHVDEDDGDKGHPRVEAEGAHDQTSKTSPSRTAREGTGTDSRKKNLSSSLKRTERKRTAAAAKASQPDETHANLSAVRKGAPREGSKLAELIGLMSRKDGATIDELIRVTKWLPHTTRAALTGLRKRGFTVERIRADGVTRYRVSSPPRVGAPGSVAGEPVANPPVSKGVGAAA